MWGQNQILYPSALLHRGDFWLWLKRGIWWDVLYVGHGEVVLKTTAGRGLESFLVWFFQTIFLGKTTKEVSLMPPWFLQLHVEFATLLLPVLINSMENRFPFEAAECLKICSFCAVVISNKPLSWFLWVRGVWKAAVSKQTVLDVHGCEAALKWPSGSGLC